MASTTATKKTKRGVRVARTAISYAFGLTCAFFALCAALAAKDPATTSSVVLVELLVAVFAGGLCYAFGPAKAAGSSSK